ncbi:MAG TPA: hypothetical protein GYA06_01210 [Chloroflexi bacterium]|jgi:hypothetical protein|nr:hypothetical protein [Chloroflexota bacterium]HPO58128.1 hypothetical protein [Anaerolineaceae bacterium]
MEAKEKPGQLVILVFKAVGLAAAVAALVLNILGVGSPIDLIFLQGISLVCLALVIL